MNARSGRFDSSHSVHIVFVLKLFARYKCVATVRLKLYRQFARPFRVVYTDKSKFYGSIIQYVFNYSMTHERGFFGRENGPNDFVEMDRCVRCFRGTRKRFLARTSDKGKPRLGGRS